jgi:hypothetical protein
MTGKIQIVSNAILRPSRTGEKWGMRQRCGVFDHSGQLVANAVVLSRTGNLSMSCECPEPTMLPQRTGRWLYGGIDFHHFGHSLIFSTARLWALEHLGQSIEGIVFIDRNQGGHTRTGTSRHLEKQLKALGVDLPVWTVSEPEVVEELIVPTQGISTEASLFNGIAEYQQYIRNIIAKKPKASPSHNRVYISRTKLGFHKAGLMFEDRLEGYLEQEGYLVFHPQNHSLDEQIAVYKGASSIIGVDGSALHLAAFAANETTKVAVLARRAFYAEAFAAQITAFSGAQAHPIRAYGTVYAPESAVRDGSLWFKTLCETQFPELGRKLFEKGYISDFSNWKTPIPKRIGQRLARAERRAKQKFVPVSETLREQEPGALQTNSYRQAEQ